LVKSLNKKKNNFPPQLCISGPSVLTKAGSFSTVSAVFACYHIQQCVAPVSYRREKTEIQKEFAKRNEKKERTSLVPLKFLCLFNVYNDSD
jgi:hypothetical protein